MSFFGWIIVVAAVVVGVALYRNNWDWKKAWEAIAVFALTLAGGAMQLWGG